MEFPEGVGGFKQKAFRERGMDIFWNNTINQNYDKIWETNKPSIEHWMILKRRYKCWKPQQFTQQTAPQQRT